MDIAFAIEHFKISVKQQRRKMTSMLFNICLFVFMLTFIVGNFPLSQAKPRPAPTYGGYIVPSDAAAAVSGGVERFDYDYYQSPYSEPLTESRLRRLRRGYYYVDDGFITPVSGASVPTAHRRADAVSGGDSNSVQYTPLVKYKHTRTKHKKLFVPNLFG